MLGKPTCLITHAQTHPPLAALDEEVARVREAFVEAGSAEPQPLLAATKERIFDELTKRGERIVVVHFAGHANGKGVLLPGKADESERLSHMAGLAGALKSLKLLKLVFLNGCATQDQVEILRQAGIPAVIATLRDIDDKVAMEFASRFYKCLSVGKDIQFGFDQAESDLVSDLGEDNFRGAYNETSDATEWPWVLHGTKSARAWSLSTGISQEPGVVSAADRRRLVELLAKCPSFGDRRKRETVLKESEIGLKLDRNPN